MIARQVTVKDSSGQISPEFFTTQFTVDMGRLWGYLPSQKISPQLPGRVTVNNG